MLGSVKMNGRLEQTENGAPKLLLLECYRVLISKITSSG